LVPNKVGALCPQQSWWNLAPNAIGGVVWEFREGVYSCLGGVDGLIGGGGFLSRNSTRTGNFEGFGKPTPQLSPGQQEVRLDESTLRQSAKSRTDTKVRVLVCRLFGQRGNCTGPGADFRWRALPKCKPPTAC